jgi:hypothetical protein
MLEELRQNRVVVVNISLLGGETSTSGKKVASPSENPRLA